MPEQIDRKIENARDNMKIAVALSDLSASEISQKAGLSINVLGKFMRGETSISFANMQAVCDVMNIPVALITSSHSISPARIRLFRMIDRMSDAEIEKLITDEGITPPQ